MSDLGKIRWSEEDLALLRTLGGRMSQLIHGEDIEVPAVDRRDELGILVNMVSRLGRELAARRTEDLERHEELSRRVAELQSAYETQEKLLAALRHLPSPILEIHERILLVPLPALDPAQATFILRSLISHAAARRAVGAIIHLSSGDGLSPESMSALLRVDRALRHGGTRAILSGVPAPHPPALSPMSPCETLPEALTAALDLSGYRITR